MNELAQEIHEIAKSKGFHDHIRRLGELLMLVVFLRSISKIHSKMKLPMP